MPRIPRAETRRCSCRDLRKLVEMDVKGGDPDPLANFTLTCLAAGHKFRHTRFAPAPPSSPRVRMGEVATQRPPIHPVAFVGSGGGRARPRTYPAVERLKFGAVTGTFSGTKPIPTPNNPLIL